MARKRQARRCKAHHADGSACKAFAVTGTVVCSAHGGRAPQVRRAAQRRTAEDAAAAAAERFGVPAPTTAADALREELARSHGIVLWALAEVGKLAESGDLTWGVRERRIRVNQAGQGQGQPQVLDTTLAASLHPMAGMLERERAHLARVAEVMERLGLEARQVRVNEAIGFRVLQAMRAVLADLGLSQEQLELAKESLPRRLREMVTPDRDAG